MTANTVILRTALWPIEPFLSADDVIEVVINRPGEVGVERLTGWEWHECPELDTAALEALAVGAAALTRQDVGADRPICSTVLPGDERCQIVMPPAAEGASSITIRKPSSKTLTMSDLARGGLFKDGLAAAEDLARGEDELARLHRKGDWETFLREAVKVRKNILISGATGSGKTTLAKALIAEIPANERIITIEDTREREVPHRNKVHLLYSKGDQGFAKVNAKDLLESSLRMRPDRILLQELRDGTAFFYLRNVNSGHPGSITTVHANSAALAFEQLTLLVKESEGGRDLAREDIRSLLRLLVDVVVQVKRVGDRFVMTEIAYEHSGERKLAD